MRYVRIGALTMVFTGCTSRGTWDWGEFGGVIAGFIFAVLFFGLYLYLKLTEE